MNADGYQDRVNAVTAEVIGAAHRVSSILGCGFLEKVYENALRIEVERAGLPTRQQHAVDVLFRDQVVGKYFADLVVADAVVIELKAASAFDRVHEAQCINYLRATGLHVCLLLNFGRPRLEVRRIVLGL
jgi:GxxExxY protein